jgi:hypothetical protein
MQRKHPRHRGRRLTAVGLAAVVFVGLAACGDDDDGADAGDDSPSTTAEPRDVDPAGDGDTGDTGGGTVAVEACDAYVDFSAALIVGEPEPLTAAAEAMVAALPEDLAGAGDTLLVSIGEGGEGMGGPDFSGAANEIGAALYEGCASDEQLDVSGVDYAFEGLPAEIGAGRVAIRFTNETAAAEPHELVLFRRNEGTTESVTDLMALPPDQIMAKVTMAGVVFVEEPDAASTLIVDLEPGEYVALCMIPVGGGEEGEPHALHGMVAELTVT